jgi:nucleoside-diphosphate-sugar epimerase
VGTANVLEAARRFDAKRIVFISSTAITNYGHIDPSGFLRTGSVYASTKLACEDLGLNYMHEYGNEFIALRLSAVISPGSTEDVENQLKDLRSCWKGL